MKISELPGQSVWVDARTPVLFDTDTASPSPLAHHIIVEIVRVTQQTRVLPALAIWRDGKRERGVAATDVVHHVMSLPPAGDAWIVRAGTALGDKLGIARKTR